MAWTKLNLLDVEDAILHLSTAKRNGDFKFMVAVDLGGRVEQYSVVRLPELMALRDQMKVEISASSGNRRGRVLRSGSFSKGL